MSGEHQHDDLYYKKEVTEALSDELKALEGRVTTLEQPSLPDPDPEPPPPDEPDGVGIPDGAHIQTVVDAHPPGTTFILEGAYERQTILPRSRDIYVGGILEGENDAPYAFYAPMEDNTVTHVEVRGTIVKNYSPTLDWQAAIQAHHQTGWQLIGVEVTGSKYAGAFLGDRAIIRGGRYYKNHELGAKVSGGGCLFEDAEFSENNFADRNNPLHEAAGLKQVYDTPEGPNVCRRLWVWGNHGAGIWNDINNNYGLVEECIVEDNTRGGIITEISKGTTIRRNAIRRNGYKYAWEGWGSAIQIQSASEIDAYQNILEDNHNGIIIVAKASRGHPYTNINVYNNHDTGSENWALGAWGDAALANSGIRFLDNTNPTDSRFRWVDTEMGKPAWEALWAA